MKRFLFALGGGLVCLALALPGPASAQEFDLIDGSTGAPAAAGTPLSFTADDWREVTGGWNRAGGDTRLTSSRAGKGIILYEPGGDPFLFTSGVVDIRFKLVSSRKKRNGAIVFADAWGDGAAYRFVSFVAGRRGKIVVGQVGDVGGVPATGFKKVARTRIRPRKWYRARLEVGEDGSVAVFFGVKEPLKEKLRFPGASPVEGSLGLRTVKSKSAFEDFSFFVSKANYADTACPGCHAGQGGAPDVYAHWTGSLAGTQDGGHGDPDGRAALTCTGAEGCHDMSGPAGVQHRGGSHETIANPSRNTALLQQRFLTPVGGSPWAIAQGFNTTCVEACHLGINLGICVGEGHQDSKKQGVPHTARFGWDHTYSDADGSNGPRQVPLWIDSDLTLNVSVSNPDFALCVSCHDPHGSNVVEGSSSNNHMLRFNWISPPTLCLSCHK